MHTMDNYLLEFVTGIECVIMNGENPKRLYDLMEGKPIGTRFTANKEIF